MITQTRWTTTERGEPLQVAVWICTDDWSPVTCGYRDLGPFDDPEECESTLTAHLKRVAAGLDSKAPPEVKMVVEQPTLF